MKYLTCPPLLFWQWRIHRWDWACRTFSRTRSPRTCCWWRAGCASHAAIQTCRLWNRTMSWTRGRKCWSRLGGQLFCNWQTGRGLPYENVRWLSDLCPVHVRCSQCMLARCSCGWPNCLSFARGRPSFAEGTRLQPYTFNRFRKIKDQHFPKKMKMIRKWQRFESSLSGNSASQHLYCVTAKC